MRCVLPLAFLLLSSIVNAQDPPAPVQLARRAGFLSPDYYQQQMPLWSDYLADHPQDSHAWRSRYLSAEYSRSADAEQLIEGILQVMACKAAIKANQQLSRDEMESLLARRDEIDKASSCPHGRPTTLKLTLQDLEKQFKRT